MLVIVILSRWPVLTGELPPASGGLWKESACIWEPPEGQRARRHFLSRLQFPTQTEEEESWGGSPPSFSRLCGGVIFWLRHQFPLPFPPCPQHVSPLIHTEKTLPGLLKRLWGGWGPSKSPSPWCLRSCLPASSWGRARGKVGGDGGCSLQTPTPLSSSFLPHHHPYPERPKHKTELGSCEAKGRASQQDKQAALALPRPQEWPTPHHSWDLVQRQGEIPGPGLACWFPAPRHHHALLWPTDQVLGNC